MGCKAAVWISNQYFGGQGQNNIHSELEYVDGLKRLPLSPCSLLSTHWSVQTSTRLKAAEVW